MKRRGLVLVVVLFMFLYIVPMNLLSTSAPSAIPAENNLLSDDAVLAQGSIMKSEHGKTVYHGGGVYSYSTSLGEMNTDYYGDWVPYVYNDFMHSVVFAGHRLVLYDWYATFENVTSGVLVDDIRWIVQYWQTQGGGRWRELDLWEHSFLVPDLNDNYLDFGQRYTDGFSSLDVVYRVSNFDQFKVTLDFTSDTVREHRFIWKFTGVAGELIGSNKSIQFDDINIGWGDADLNATYDWTVADKKVDIVFDSFIGSNYTLDPSISSVLGGDIDDDYWWYNSAGPTWTHETGYTQVRTLWSGTSQYLGQMRFSLDIPKDATIDSATITHYESQDVWVSGNTGKIWRINETNVGSLEGDTSHPIRSNTTVMDAWPWDGVTLEWTVSDVSTLVQEQVNLNDWESSFYIGFRFGYIGVQTTHNRYEDYQHADSHDAYLNVTYSAAVTTTTTTIVAVEGINILEELFLSVELFGYIGPMAIVLIGYVVTKKERILGVLYFIFECLLMAQYFALLDATPAYWWHIILLLIGGITTCVFPQLDR